MTGSIRSRKNSEKMILKQELNLEGTTYQITISDNSQALRGAYEAGQTVIGLWDPKNPDRDLNPAEYVVEFVEDLSPQMLERIVRRRHGLPWQIARTQRLTIREFVPEDYRLIPVEEDANPEETLFSEENALREYISGQYGFYEYGIWAVTDRCTGVLYGIAGLCPIEEDGWDKYFGLLRGVELPVEIGYRIFAPYRGRGYAKEACRAILAYGAKQVSGRIYARIDRENQISVRLAQELGFRLMGPADKKSGARLWLDVGNCS